MLLGIFVACQTASVTVRLEDASTGILEAIAFNLPLEGIEVTLEDVDEPRMLAAGPNPYNLLDFQRTGGAEIYNLMDLPQVVAMDEIPAGTLVGVRLVLIDIALPTLIEPTGRLRELPLAPGAYDGLKFVLDVPVVDGSETELVLSIDTTGSLVHDQQGDLRFDPSLSLVVAE